MMLLSLSLYGCGWTPLYTTESPDAGITDASITDASIITIDPIPERAGQLLRSYLRLNLRGVIKQNLRYRLTVRLNTSSDLSGLQRDATYTRSNLNAVAYFQLSDSQNDKIIFKGQKNISTNFDYVPEPYANLIAQREYTKRLMKRLAERISITILAFIKKNHKT